MKIPDGSTPEERRQWLLNHLVPLASQQNPDNDYRRYVQLSNQEWIDKSYLQLRYDIRDT